VVAGATELRWTNCGAQYGSPHGHRRAGVSGLCASWEESEGHELGYAIGYEVMLSTAGPAKTNGPRAVSRAEFYDRLVTEFSRSRSANARASSRVDLDLRRYGSAGSRVGHRWTRSGAISLLGPGLEL